MHSFSDQFSKLKNTESYSVALSEAEKELSEANRESTSTSSTEKNDAQAKASETSGAAAANRGLKNASSKISANSIRVNPKQRGNPLLKSITATPWEYDDSIIPDYVMGATTCALFLSLKYHSLKPDYINDRIKQLGRMYELRVLLVQVDLEDPHHALKHLVRVCLLCDLTLMLAWNSHEAGKIIETYKVYEYKPPDAIMERQESDIQLQVMNALTSIRSVNRTDAATLLATFKSLKNIVNASKESLSLCPGLGAQKASRLQAVLKQPFLKSKNQKPLSQQKDITSFLKKS